MQKKLTITIAEDVYAGLHQVVGRRKISRFIESLVRPYVIYGDEVNQEGYRSDGGRYRTGSRGDGVDRGHGRGYP